MREPKKKIRLASIALTIVLIGSVYTQATETVKYINTINLPDTRWVSIEWIKKNIPEGSTIGREHYTPPLEEYTDNYKVTFLGIVALPRKLEEIEKLEYMILSSEDYDRFLKEVEKNDS